MRSIIVDVKIGDNRVFAYSAPDDVAIGERVLLPSTPWQEGDGSQSIGTVVSLTSEYRGYVRPIDRVMTEEEVQAARDYRDATNARYAEQDRIWRARQEEERAAERIRLGKQPGRYVCVPESCVIDPGCYPKSPKRRPHPSTHQCDILGHPLGVHYHEERFA